jgi:putative ABC transport system permease protein
MNHEKDQPRRINHEKDEAMTRIRVWWSRALDAVFRSRRDARLSEELQAHLDLLTEEHVAHGLSLKEARLAARKAFGGVDQVAARYRDQRGFPSVESWLQDVRFAFRLFRRERGFMLTVILVLAIGIGVNSMFFMLVYAHTLRGLPIREADRVLYVSSLVDRVNDRPMSFRDFDDLRATQRSFDGLVAFAQTPVNLGDEGRAPERLDGTYLTANGFRVIGVSPILGRDLTADDDRPGAAPVVMLGASTWESRYTRDPTILGRSVLLNGQPATVIGVMPDRSGFPSTSTVWMPLSQRPGEDATRRDARTLRVFGRLRRGVNEADARAEAQGIVERLAQEYPQTNTNVSARVITIDRRYLQPVVGPWLAFVSAGLLVLAISCANVANVMLARTAHRTREIAIRSSLGATRPRVVRQLIVEALALGAMGCLAGLAVSLAGVQLVKSAIPPNTMPYWNDYFLDGRITVVLFAVSLLATLIFGLIPAAQASKTDVDRVLKDGGRTGTSSRGSRRWTTAFLAAELGLAIVLFGQLALSWRLNQSDVPSDATINTPEIVTATFTLSPDRYASVDQRAEFYRLLRERLQTLSGISAVSFASHLPLNGGSELGLELDDRPRGAGEAAPSVWMIGVGPGYFETLGISLVKGRGIEETDGSSGEVNAIINDRLAELYFSGRDPIGQQFALRSAGAATARRVRVVGVTPMIRQRSTTEPTVYLPLRATAQPTASLLVRSTRDVTDMTAALRRETMAIDPNLPLYRVQTMAQVIADMQWAGRVSVRMADTLTAIALLLATVGLYAVTSQSVSRRAKEIAVRMALGAKSAQVIRSVLASVAAPLVAGFVIGILGMVAWDRAFSTGRAGGHASDPVVIMAVAAIVAVITLVACFVPARRATRLDPVAALRED